MDKLEALLKKIKTAPFWVKILSCVGICILWILALVLSSCATTHTVSQSFVKSGDTLTVIKYEQVGSTKKFN